MFKRKRTFQIGDVVVPKYRFAGYYVALIVEIERNWFGISRIVVQYYEKSPVFMYSGSIRYKVSVRNDSYSSAGALEFYEHTNRLIRPLVEGDSIFLIEDFLVHYSKNDLRHQGKEEHIRYVRPYNENPNELLYVTDHGNWLLINIDIPRTNRYLMLKYKPKSSPALPIL